MTLAALLEAVTPASYDGATLELAFPPTWKSNAVRVQSRAKEVNPVLQELFGISPQLRCVVREPVASMTVELDEEPPPTEEDALARLKAELGAEQLAGDPEPRA